MLFFIIILWTGFAMLFAAITYFLFTHAVIFARGTISLFIGFILSQQYDFLVPTSSFLNGIAWIAICLCVIYVLSILPRLDIAIRFLCTLFVSLFGSVIFIPTIISALSSSFEVTAAIEIFMKIVCIIISILAIVLQGKKLSSDFGSNIIMRAIDRFLASCLYGLCVYFLISPVYGQWSISSIVYDIIFVAIVLGTFVADIFLAKKTFFGYTPLEEIEMPR